MKVGNLYKIYSSTQDAVLWSKHDSCNYKEVVGYIYPADIFLVVDYRRRVRVENCKEDLFHTWKVLTPKHLGWYHLSHRILTPIREQMLLRDRKLDIVIEYPTYDDERVIIEEIISPPPPPPP